MTGLDKVLERLISEKSPAKLAGARTANRLHFQVSESLFIIIDHYDKAADFLAVFDYHEDFILYLKNDEEYNGIYYQVKTGKTNWTIDSLVAANQKSGSILFKLFEIGTKFNACSLEFVSNKKVKARKKDDKKPTTNEVLKLKDLHDSEAEKIVIHLQGSSVNNLSNIATTRLSSLPLKSKDRETFIKGKLVEFVTNNFEDPRYKPYMIYLSVTNEIERRLRFEDEIESIDEVKKTKCLSREELNRIIKLNLKYETLENTLGKIEGQLQAESVEFNEIKKIRNGIMRLNALRISKHKTYSQLEIELRQKMKIVESKSKSLFNIARDKFEIIRIDEAIKELMEILVVNNEELFSMVVYEEFES